MRGLRMVTGEMLELVEVGYVDADRDAQRPSGMVYEVRVESNESEQRTLMRDDNDKLMDKRGIFVRRWSVKLHTNLPKVISGIV